jgi:hypothetical protein
MAGKGGLRSTSFKKGEAKGKPKGAINKVNKDTKEAIKMLIENNLDNMTIWLGTIATKNPEKAMYIIVNLLEYSIPKLARTEVTGKDGKDFIPENATITFK